VANAFISPFNTQTMQIKSFYTQQHCYVSLKTLYPGGIRTRVFLFLRRMRCPLRHAARAKKIIRTVIVKFWILTKKVKRNKKMFEWLLLWRYWLVSAEPHFQDDDMLRSSDISVLFVAAFRAGWPDWANFRPTGDCLLWAVFRKLQKLPTFLPLFPYE
jgi:hypothetical protein